MTETEQAVITKWRDRATAAVRSLVELQERYDQVQTEAEALRPLRAALLRYGQALVAFQSAHDRGRGSYAERAALLVMKTELDGLALALATEEGPG